MKELIVDLFAGGGGASTGIFQVTGRHPDIAINHNDDALSMHRENHPETTHYVSDIYEVCPRAATQGRPVGWMHLSPDCTHHSQAAGGQPRSKKLRSLAWVGLRWAGQVGPRIISLENVTQILKWGPLVAKRDKASGRVIKLDGSVAAPGERVPVQMQHLVPDPKRTGTTWRRFCSILRKLGYHVESKTLCAADFGAPTTRERLFLLARRDGLPIVWPEPTHARSPEPGQEKWRGAAECINFNTPCPSIFDRKKPLADATMRRIAKGLQRYVLDSANPFIVPIAHYNGRDVAYLAEEPLRTITAATKGGEFALAAPVIVPATHQGADRMHDIEQPLPTVTCANRGELMLTSPICVQVAHGEGKPGKTQRWGSGSRDITGPIGTVTASGGYALSAAHLIQLNNHCDARNIEEPLKTISAGGEHHGAVVAFLSRHFGCSIGQSVEAPAPTVMTNGGGKSGLVAATLITNTSKHSATDLRDPTPTVTTGNHHACVSAFLTSYYTDESNRARSLDDPAATITTENRLGLVEVSLSPDQIERAEQVAYFLMRYHGTGGQHSDVNDPMTTITTKDRLALVSVNINGVPHVIVDIGLRMLHPEELFKAQGFPDNYEIAHGHDGRKFTKTAQVRLCGNSVPPALMKALVSANYTPAVEMARKNAA